MILRSLINFTKMENRGNHIFLMLLVAQGENGLASNPILAPFLFSFSSLSAMSSSFMLLKIDFCLLFFLWTYLPFYLYALTYLF